MRTAKRKEAIRRYIEEQTPLNQVARKLGLTRDMVRRDLNKAGVPIRNRKEARQIREEKMQLALSFVTNMSVIRAADKAGVSESGLRRRMKVAGVKAPRDRRSNEEFALGSFHARRAMRDMRDDGMDPKRIAKAWKVSNEVAQRILREAW